MRFVSLVLTSFVASLLVSGCLATAPEKKAPINLGGGGRTLQEGLAPFVNPIVLDHDHTDLEEHAFANNVELVAVEPMGPNGPLGGGWEIDVASHYAFIALGGYGFAIEDIADPLHPKLVSTTKIEVPQTPTFGAYTADLKVDKTGDWIFVAMELSTTPGVFIYDATDKTAPRLAGFWAEPGKFLGCHMIEYAQIGDQEYLFCAPLDAAIYVGLILPPAGGTREIVQVGRWQPATVKFAQWFAQSPTTRPAEYALSGHDDMTFELDPLNGKPTLFVSFWEMGVWFLDVSVPAVPMALGTWFGEGAKLYDGQIHTAMSFRSGDRRIVVAIPEVAKTPAVFVLDATDFGNPKVIAEWTAMEDWGNQSGSFSTHNFQIVDEKLYLTHYHGGLWVLDLSVPEKPEPIGSYVTHEPRMDGKGYASGNWDVVVYNGYMLTADGDAGFYVLHFLGDPAGEADYSSFA